MRGNEEIVGADGSTAALERGSDLGVVKSTFLDILKHLHIAEILIVAGRMLTGRNLLDSAVRGRSV